LLFMLAHIEPPGIPCLSGSPLRLKIVIRRAPVMV
jgi:hypothetical protein